MGLAVPKPVSHKRLLKRFIVDEVDALLIVGERYGGASIGFSDTNKQCKNHAIVGMPIPIPKLKAFHVDLSGPSNIHAEVFVTTSVIQNIDIYNK